jgi:hypothetical protein
LIVELNKLNNYAKLRHFMPISESSCDRFVTAAAGSIPGVFRLPDPLARLGACNLGHCCHRPTRSYLRKRRVGFFYFLLEVTRRFCGGVLWHRDRT